MFFKKKEPKIGSTRTINSVPCLYCSHRWLPLKLDSTTYEVEKYVEMIKHKFVHFIRHELAFIDNNPVLKELPKESRFPHVLYLINYTEIYNLPILNMYRNIMMDDNHARSYTRWLETFINIQLEIPNEVIDILTARFINSIIRYKTDVNIAHLCVALSYFPWLFALPLYNDAYNIIHIDVD